MNEKYLSIGLSAAGAVLIILGIVGYMYQESPQSVTGQKQVLLLTVEDLPIDFMNGPKAAPSLNLLRRVAGQSLKFRKNFSTSSTPTTSLVSALTSLSPYQHMVVLDPRNPQRKNLNPAGQARVASGLSSPYFSDALGNFVKVAILQGPQGRLFEDTLKQKGFSEIIRIAPKQLPKSFELRTNRVLGEARSVFAKNENKNIFVWAHLTDLSLPLGPVSKEAKAETIQSKTLQKLDLTKASTGEEFAKSVKRGRSRAVQEDLKQYRMGMLASWDDELRPLLGILRKYPAMLAIVAGISNNGGAEYGVALTSEELTPASIRTPLLIHYPEVEGSLKGGSTGAITSILDIGPTVLDYAEVEPLPTLQGKSLWPLRDPELRKKREPRILFATNVSRNMVQHARISPQQVTIVSGRLNPKGKLRNFGANVSYRYANKGRNFWYPKPIARKSKQAQQLSRASKRALGQKIGNANLIALANKSGDPKGRLRGQGKGAQRKGNGKGANKKQPEKAASAKKASLSPTTLTKEKIEEELRALGYLE